MPHCGKEDFRGRWLVGMTPWNQKRFIPEDQKKKKKKKDCSQVRNVLYYASYLLS